MMPRYAFGQFSRPCACPAAKRPAQTSGSRASRHGSSESYRVDILLMKIEGVAGARPICAHPQGPESSAQQGGRPASRQRRNSRRGGGGGSSRTARQKQPPSVGQQAVFSKQMLGFDPGPLRWWSSTQPLRHIVAENATMAIPPACFLPTHHQRLFAMSVCSELAACDCVAHMHIVCCRR